jgi:hypothetical protein
MRLADLKISQVQLVVGFAFSAIDFEKTLTTKSFSKKIIRI